MNLCGSKWDAAVSLSSHFAASGSAASWWGDPIFTREPSRLLWRHELEHVRQYERYGLAFLPLYLWLYARRGYGAHPFEREAEELATLEA